MVRTPILSLGAALLLSGKALALGAIVHLQGAEGDREAFFAEADILSLHLPLNKETTGLITRDDLARMKPSALIVNTSRAGLIADGALAQALNAGRPGFAAVDVYEDEPVLGANHPLLKMANVICTPHLGYVTRESYEEYYDVPVDDILAYAAGKPSHVLNPEALGRRTD